MSLRYTEAPRTGLDWRHHRDHASGGVIWRQDAATEQDDWQPDAVEDDSVVAIEAL